MAERFIFLYAETNTLGEQHMLDLAHQLGCGSWHGHTDGGEAVMAAGVCRIGKHAVRIILQLGGRPTTEGFRLRDEGQICVVVHSEDRSGLKAVVPSDRYLPEFLLGVDSLWRSREGKPRAKVLDWTGPFGPREACA